VSVRARSVSQAPPRLAVVVAALAVVYVVWGSTYLGIKLAIETLPPMLMASTRFLIAGVLLYAWTARPGRGVRLSRPTRVEWIAAAVCGNLMLVGGNGAVTWAEQRIDSGIAALLVATVPLWMALLGWWRQGHRLRPGAIAGLVLGFGGVALLVRPSSGATDLAAALAVVGGAFLWAAGSLYVRTARLHRDPLRATAMQMLAGSCGFALLGTLGGEQARLDLAGASATSIGALLYLAVFGSLVAFSAYTWLLRNAAPATVSTYAYVNPIVAVLLGAAILAEPITPSMLAAGALIVAGVALIVTSRRTISVPVPAAGGADSTDTELASRPAGSIANAPAVPPAR
jgi:drug/metabolite transporter (DMT)-like permease